MTRSFAAIDQGTIAATLAGAGAHALKEIAGNPLAGGASFARSFRIFCGDFNGDGVVNQVDADLARARIGSKLCGGSPTRFDRTAEIG